jgi:hypothetical protein
VARAPAKRRRGLAGRALRTLAVALVAVVAVLAVAIAFFPFERLAPLAEAQLSRLAGAEARIGALDVRLRLRGPELTAHAVALRWPSGEALALDELRMRAARPGAWLRGVPTAHVALRAPFGAFDGDVSREQVAGDLSGFDLALLPSAGFGGGGALLAGPVDARVDLRRSEPEASGSWTGSIALSGVEGSLALPGSPVAIPYERLDAGARLAHDGTLHLDSLALAGPMVSAHASGVIAAGPRGPASGSVAIDARVERLDPALVPALAQYGVALDANGAGRLSVVGVVGSIRVR